MRRVRDNFNWGEGNIVALRMRSSSVSLRTTRRCRVLDDDLGIGQSVTTHTTHQHTILPLTLRQAVRIAKLVASFTLFVLGEIDPCRASSQVPPD